MEGASVPLAELQAVAEELGTDLVRATALHAAGVVASVRGDPHGAGRLLADAVGVLEGAGAPYETGLARLEFARALHDAGQHGEATEEAALALELFQRLGADGALERARSFLQRLESGSPDATKAAAAGRRPSDERLTPRQLTVLRLVAEGMSDREIAERLFLSEHTVHRHVANILARLRVPSRTAAVTAAMREGLL